MKAFSYSPQSSGAMKTSYLGHFWECDRHPRDTTSDWTPEWGR